MGLIDAQPQSAQPIPAESQQTPQTQQPSKDEETFRRLGMAAMKIIYSKPESDHIVEILKSGADNPPRAVAQATFVVISRIQNDTKGIDPRLAYSVAAPVIALIFELGESAGVFDEKSFPEDTDADKLIGAALTELAALTKTQQQGIQPQQPQPQSMQQPMTGV